MNKVVGKLKEKKFSLYGVFDGHQGKFAAEYVKTRLPYELVYVLQTIFEHHLISRYSSTPEFAAGNYEAALKAAYNPPHYCLMPRTLLIIF